MLDTPDRYRLDDERPSLDALIAAVLAGGNRESSSAQTLPAGTYVSPDFFNLEVEKIFRKDWICVGHVSQVPNVGDYFTLDLFGDLLMVVRGSDRVRVLSRVCLHRWAPVATGEGNVKLFSCPFHRWGYGLDGQLLGAPFMDQAAGFQPKDCRLPEVRTEIVEALGLIFISFSDETGSITDRLQDFCDKYRNWDSKNLVAVRPRDPAKETADPWTRNHFNWKIQVETFMECYHHIGAHTETFEVEQPARLSWCEEGGPGWTVCHSPFRDDAPQSAYTLGFPVIAGITEDELRVCDYVLIYPMLLLMLRPDSVSFVNLLPVHPTLTLSQFFTLVSKEAAQDPELIKARFAARRDFMNKANQEDNDVNEMQQAGANSSFAATGRLSHLESTVADLAEYIRKRISANA